MIFNIEDLWVGAIVSGAKGNKCEVIEIDRDLQIVTISISPTENCRVPLDKILTIENPQPAIGKKVKYAGETFTIDRISEGVVCGYDEDGNYHGVPLKLLGFGSLKLSQQPEIYRSIDDDLILLAAAPKGEEKDVLQALYSMYSPTQLIEASRRLKVKDSQGFNKISQAVKQYKQSQPA